MTRSAKQAFSAAEGEVGVVVAGEYAFVEIGCDNMQGDGQAADHIGLRVVDDLLPRLVLADLPLSGRNWREVSDTRCQNENSAPRLQMLCGISVRFPSPSSDVRCHG